MSFPRILVLLIAALSFAATGCTSGGTSDDTVNVDQDPVVGDDSPGVGGGDPGVGGGGLQCGLEVPLFSTQCAPATGECLFSGGDFETCISADPNPDACVNCIDANFFACAAETACAGEYDAADCCIGNAIETICPDESCVETECGAEIEAFIGCYNAFDGAGCGQDLMQCFI